MPTVSFLLIIYRQYRYILLLLDRGRSQHSYCDNRNAMSESIACKDLNSPTLFKYYWWDAIDILIQLHRRP